MSNERQVQCPICAKSVSLQPRTTEFPFCSLTCKNIDLGRWLDQRYAVDMRTGRLGVIDEDAEVEELDEKGSERSDFH